MGVFIIKKEGDPEHDPEDIGVLIEGVEVLSGLGDTPIALCALLFGLIYSLNLSYVLQKIFRKLEGQKLSSKAQFLKNNLMGWNSVLFWFFLVLLISLGFLVLLLLKLCEKQKSDVFLVFKVAVRFNC